MDTACVIVPLRMDDGVQVELRLFPEGDSVSSIQILDPAEAAEYGEASVQLAEGFGYEYALPLPYRLREIPGMVSISRAGASTGRITPNTYTGLLTLEVLGESSEERRGIVALEVRSTKTAYRYEYRSMLEYITEKCTDLLMQSSSNVSGRFETDPENDAQTKYQRFAFVQSIIGSREFTDAINRILETPVTSWAHKEENLDTRKARRMTRAIAQQFAAASHRVPLPDGHPLRTSLDSVPSSISLYTKRETVDTPENRFVKHVLGEFLLFCSETRRLIGEGRAYREALQLERILENILGHALFKEVSAPLTLRLNSPVLQRREGYREVLRAWLMYDLAAKLSWKGGEDVYHAGQRNLATLYEYWVFFVLLDITCGVLDMEAPPAQELITFLHNGLSLKLKSGKRMTFRGVYTEGAQAANVAFNYNRTYNGGRSHPESGSWTRDLRPDYSISIWPVDLTADAAEESGQMVHIHFDAKYKTDNLEEDDPEDGACYKREDLLKMHTYKDAIRRTEGSYVLYPGDTVYHKPEHTLLLPGIGAFPLRPGNTADQRNIQSFITSVLTHVLSRTGA